MLCGRDYDQSEILRTEKVLVNIKYNLMNHADKQILYLIEAMKVNKLVNFVLLRFWSPTLNQAVFVCSCWAKNAGWSV